jgi:ribose transport system permease protein
MENTVAIGEKKRTNYFRQDTVLVGLIIVICIVTAIVNPRFLRVQNLINIFQQISILGIVACGVGMLLIAGQIDISVGTQMSLMGMIFCIIIQRMMGLPNGTAPAWQAALALPLGVAVTFVIGFLLGLINGLIVTRTGAASFIITLGMSTAYHGAALVVSGGASYMLFGKFELIGRGRVLDIVPISILIFLGVVVITFAVLRFFRYGRFLYAIGGNKKAAFVSGIRTNRITVTAYVIVGLCNALAALILMSRVGSALAWTADAYSLDSLAAVIVGGVALAGGRGSAVSVFLGVLLVGLISNALIIMNVNPFFRDIVIGLIIVIAVTVGEISNRRS